jgi:23S rRNA (cytidine1920-2'-O)/16S rRNA (cytidine1409-2'-O)-methyltransferase
VRGETAGDETTEEEPSQNDPAINKPTIRLYERTNARTLAPGSLLPQPGANPPGPTLTLLVMDVSFISATLVLPAVIRSVSAYPDVTGNRTREIVVLVKPQFEAGRELVGKGGIVRDESAQKAAVTRVEKTLIELGCIHAEFIESPILGGEGNREFLLHAEFPALARK